MNDSKPKCGVIAPISASSEIYTAEHWKKILDAITKELSDYEVRLVSRTDEVAVIQSTIVRNIYNDDIVVADVTTQNPNVMFEVGLRLAFGKPIVLIQDSGEKFIFDTGPIEHIVYPQNLEYTTFAEFLRKLSSKVKDTHVYYQQTGSTDFTRTFANSLSGNTLESVDLLDRLNDILSKVSNYDTGISSIHSRITSIDSTVEQAVLTLSNHGYSPYGKRGWHWGMCRLIDEILNKNAGICFADALVKVNESMLDSMENVPASSVYIQLKSQYGMP